MLWSCVLRYQGTSPTVPKLMRVPSDSATVSTGGGSMPPPNIGMPVFDEMAALTLTETMVSSGSLRAFPMAVSLPDGWSRSRRARSPSPDPGHGRGFPRATSGPEGSQPRTEARRPEAVIQSGRLARRRASRWRSLGRGRACPSVRPRRWPPGPGSTRSRRGHRAARRGCRGAPAPIWPGPAARSGAPGPRPCFREQGRPMRSGGWAVERPRAGGLPPPRPLARVQRVQMLPLESRSRCSGGVPSLAPGCQGTIRRAPGRSLPSSQRCSWQWASPWAAGAGPSRPRGPGWPGGCRPPPAGR